MYSSTQQVDEMWDDYFAKSDATRERYAAEMHDLKIDAIMQREHEEYMTKVWNAGYGDDQDAYEQCWERMFKYGESGAA